MDCACIRIGEYEYNREVRTVMKRKKVIRFLSFVLLGTVCLSVSMRLTVFSCFWRPCVVNNCFDSHCRVLLDARLERRLIFDTDGADTVIDLGIGRMYLSETNGPMTVTIWQTVDGEESELIWSRTYTDFFSDEQYDQIVEDENAVLGIKKPVYREKIHLHLPEGKHSGTIYIRSSFEEHSEELADSLVIGFVSNGVRTYFAGARINRIGIFGYPYLYNSGYYFFHSGWV